MTAHARSLYAARPLSLRVAAVAAATMLASATSIGALVMLVTGELSFFQPSETPATVAAMIAPTNEHPDAAVAYFTLDTAFVISFTLVFVGLYVFTRDRAPAFSRFALAAGVFTGLMDAVENAIYWSYAMQASAGVPLADAENRLLFVLTNLKLAGFFATYFTFALIFPRRSRLEAAASLVMLLPPTLGLLSLGVRDIAEVRPILFSAPALLLAMVFATRPAPGPARSGPA